MRKTPLDPQELRRRIYLKAKSEIWLGRRGVRLLTASPVEEGIITLEGEVGRESRVREILTHGSMSGGEETEMMVRLRETPTRKSGNGKPHKTYTSTAPLLDSTLHLGRGRGRCHPGLWASRPRQLAGAEFSSRRSPRRSERAREERRKRSCRRRRGGPSGRNARRRRD